MKKRQCAHNMADQPYHKVRDERSPNCIKKCWSWITQRRRGHVNDMDSDDVEYVPLQTPQDVRVRVAKRMKKINLRVMFLEKRATKIEAQGKTYIKKGQNMRAESEAKVYMHIQQKIRTLLNIHTKLRLLVQEMDTMNTLAQCMDALSTGSEALGQQIRDNLDIGKIDDMMAEWNLQMRDADEVARTMVQPIAAQPTTSDNNVLSRIHYHDETDASSLLMHWRVETLEALDTPATSVAPLVSTESVGHVPTLLKSD